MKKWIPILCVGFLVASGSAVLANRKDCDCNRQTAGVRRHHTRNVSTASMRTTMRSPRYRTAAMDREREREMAAREERREREMDLRAERREREHRYEFVNDRSDLGTYQRNEAAVRVDRDRWNHDVWYRENAYLDPRYTSRNGDRLDYYYYTDNVNAPDEWWPVPRGRNEWRSDREVVFDRNRHREEVFIGYNADSRHVERHPEETIPAHVDPRAPEYSWPAVDYDNDGVPDRIDRCPDTPPGADVDAWGCPFESTSNHDLIEVAAYPAGVYGYPPATYGHVQESILRRGTFTLDMAFFDTNRSEIRPDAEPALLAVADVIKGYPTLKFEIAGHADSRGPTKYNHQLSEARARAVRHFLIWEGGVRDNQIETRGYGEKRLATPERNAQELQANRRVDFRVVNPEAIPRGSKPERMGAVETLVAQERGGRRPQDSMTYRPARIYGEESMAYRPVRVRGESMSYRHARVRGEWMSYRPARVRGEESMAYRQR